MLKSLAVFPLKRVGKARCQFSWIRFPYAGPFSAGLQYCDCDKMLIFSLNHDEQLVHQRVPHDTGYTKAPPSVIFMYVFCKYLSKIHTNTFSLQDRHKALVAGKGAQVMSTFPPQFDLIFVGEALTLILGDLEA